MLVRNKLQESVGLDILKPFAHEGRHELLQLHWIFSRLLFPINEPVQYNAPVLRLFLLAALGFLEEVTKSHMEYPLRLRSMKSSDSRHCLASFASMLFKDSIWRLKWRRWRSMMGDPWEQSSRSRRPWEAERSELGRFLVFWVPFSLFSSGFWVSVLELISKKRLLFF